MTYHNPDKKFPLDIHNQFYVGGTLKYNKAVKKKKDAFFQALIPDDDDDLTIVDDRPLSVHRL